VEAVLTLKHHDPEEHLYREGMLTQFVNVALILLRFSASDHVHIYQLFEELLNKTAGAYDLAESFTIAITVSMPRTLRPTPRCNWCPAPEARTSRRCACKVSTWCGF
jgi:hypothetical protein